MEVCVKVLVMVWTVVCVLGLGLTASKPNIIIFYVDDVSSIMILYIVTWSTDIV